MSATAFGTENATPAAKRRRGLGRAFAVITFVPVALALVFITALLVRVVLDTASWQVVRPAGSGSSFAWGAAPLGGDRVVRLELEARGLSPEEIERTLSDEAERRAFFARNRVELMPHTSDGPWRWVVTGSRDKRVEDVPLVEGLRRLDELKASLQAGEMLYLNAWLDLPFLRADASRTPVLAGLRSALVGSALVILLVMVIAVPLGVGAAVYLEEYAPNDRLSRLIEVNIRNLAGVPSVVYGLLGLYVFVRFASMGPSVLAAALTLSLLILPVVIIAAREAIRAVPSTLRQASYGLGATRWQTVSRAVLPHAVPGIVTGVILAVARALGETAPLLLVGAAAFVPRLPDGLLSAYTVIPVQIYSWVGENEAEFAHVASAGIVVLLVLLIALYAVAYRMRKRFERTW